MSIYEMKTDQDSLRSCTVRLCVNGIPLKACIVIDGGVKRHSHSCAVDVYNRRHLDLSTTVCFTAHWFV